MEANNNATLALLDKYGVKYACQERDGGHEWANWRLSRVRSVRRKYGLFGTCIKAAQIHGDMTHRIHDTGDNVLCPASDGIAHFPNGC